MVERQCIQPTTQWLGKMEEYVVGKASQEEGSMASSIWLSARFWHVWYTQIYVAPHWIFKPSCTTVTASDTEWW